MEIWAEYEVIRYGACCNWQNYVACSFLWNTGYSHMYISTKDKMLLSVWETLLCICAALAPAHHCGVSMEMMMSSCLPVSPSSGHDTCQRSQWILKSTRRLIDQVVFKPIQWLLIRSFFLHSSTVFRISIKFLLIDLVWVADIFWQNIQAQQSI